MYKTAVAAVLVLAASAAFADTPPTPAPLNIHRTTGQITIDGDLSDSGWKDAVILDHWWETSPGDNVPPKVKTTAWVTYDDRYFYVGVKCDDPDPSKIRAPFVDRDDVIGTMDNIAVFLDTRNDKRTAMELRVSARGLQADGIYNDSGPIEDFSPDYFYDTAAKITPEGWTAEFRIPFSSLRYPKTDPQTWGLSIWRNYPRDFRYAFWSTPQARNTNCLVCHEQEITGLTGLPEAGHLVAAPYITASELEHPSDGLGTPFETDPLRTHAGLDVKYTPTANNAVDLTYNPDFSQIESDIAQISVNQRFALFFPEKRPFFLEGFDLFDTPMQVAYTRNITQPRWGVRTTGRASDTTYTLLVSQDRGGGLTIIPGTLGSSFAPQDFRALSTIGRVRHDLGSTAFIGAVLTDREAEGGGGHNRVFGPDFRWKPTDKDDVYGEVLISSSVTPNRPDLSPAWNGERLTSHAANAGWSHTTRTYDFGVFGTDIGDNFRADLGFIPQVGYRDLTGIVGYTFWPEKGFLRRVRGSVLVDHQTNTGGQEIFNQTSIGVNFFGAKNLQANVLFRPREHVRVIRTDASTTELGQSYAQWFAQIDPSQRFVRLTFQGRYGQSIDFGNAAVGHGGFTEIDATLRPLDRLTFDLISSHSWLNNGGVRLFTAQVERLKTTYNFSAKSLLRVIGQYTPADFAGGIHSGAFTGSMLYSYKVNWQTVFFVGYGDDRVLDAENRFQRLDRSVFVKVSYAYQR